MSKLDKPIKAKKALTLCIVCALVCSLLSAAYVYASSPSTFQVITSGIVPGSPTFTVFMDSGVCYAKNTYGGISYSSTNASYVLNSALAVGNVEVKDGNYTLTSKVLIDDDGRQLIGQGSNTIFKQSGAVINMIDLQGAYGDALANVVLRDFVIEGSYQDARLLNVQYAYPCTIQNVVVRNGGANTGYSVVGFQRCYRLNLYNFEVVDSNDIKVYMDQCHGFTWIGGRCGWGSGSQDGLIIIDCAGGLVEGVAFEHNGASGITIKTGPYETSSINIMGNYIEGNAGSNQITCLNGSAINIVGNYINGESISDQGIYSETPGVAIKDNTFLNHVSTFSIILADATANFTLIEHNWYKDTYIKYGNPGNLTEIYNYNIP